MGMGLEILSVKLPQRLSYDNQWEYDHYYVGKKKVKTLTRVYINGKEYPVISKRVSVPYSDMGHDYIAESTHFFVVEEVFGKKHTFDLNTVVGKSDVLALDYTLEK